MGTSFLAISFSRSSVECMLCTGRAAAVSVLKTYGGVKLKCHKTDK
jgi:hypothetical protein